MWVRLTLPPPFVVAVLTQCVVHAGALAPAALVDYDQSVVRGNPGAARPSVLQLKARRSTGQAHAPAAQGNAGPTPMPPSSSTELMPGSSGTARHALAPWLEPWNDAQPVDTAIGAILAAGLSERPTYTPPPLQSGLDLVRAACPLLTAWPSRLEIHAIESCTGGHNKGSWVDATSQDPLAVFQLSCSPLGSIFSPQVTYSTPQGEVLATSHLLASFWGTAVAIADCSGTLRYVFEEKVYKQKGSVDAASCELHGSCDGTVWIQYFLRDTSGMLLAETPYLKLFEDAFDILEPRTGFRIATAARLGAWHPDSVPCTGPHRWALTYASSPPGFFADFTEQWPIAVLLTVASIRDASRRSSGLLAPSWCEVSKVTLSFCLLFMASATVVVGVVVLLRDARQPCRMWLFDLEKRICPNRMRLPSKYDGG